MVTEDQSEVVAFLDSPSTHGGTPVVRIETHASVVFLAGATAWKMKRAVRYDYLDFSTADRRREMCEAELWVNRRTARELYLDVVPVTREVGGQLAIAGHGEPVEWLVKMARFDEDYLFDRLASANRLDLGLMVRLATAVATLHREAERRADHGGSAGMRWVVEGNVSGLTEFGGGTVTPSAVRALAEGSRRSLAAHRVRLDARQRDGFVRRGHGDLHLRNIVLLGGRPVLFDGIEFNDELACTDVFYDLAFLLMDLWHRGLPAHANAVLNGYLTETGDVDGLAVLPFFLSCRAAVRAKTSATGARMQSDPVRARELEEAAVDYLGMAQQFLDLPPACLVAIGGRSGSGKSTVARGIAPAVGAVPGAVVIRSDEVRKALAGVDGLTPLGPEGYTADMTRRVYAALAERAARALATGHAVVVDAVFVRDEHRSAIEAVAAAAHVPFVGLWLDVPEVTLLARVAQRHGDASDADARVVRRQLVEDTGVVNWTRVDATGPADDVVRRVAAMVTGRLRGGALRAPHGP